MGKATFIFLFHFYIALVVYLQTILVHARFFFVVIEIVIDFFFYETYEINVTKACAMCEKFGNQRTLTITGKIHKIYSAPT